MRQWLRVMSKRVGGADGVVAAEGAAVEDCRRPSSHKRKTVFLLRPTRRCRLPCTSKRVRRNHRDNSTRNPKAVVNAAVVGADEAVA